MNKHNWTYKKLGEVAKSELGKTLNSSKDKGKLYPYLCAVNVLWDKIDTATLKEARFEEAELEKYSVKKGDLLICEGGDIGRSAIWNKEESIQYQNALHRVRFNGEVLPRFCLIYLKSLKEKGILDTRYGKGVTIKHLVKSSLLSIPIPIPPVAEQERIVAELDLLSSIINKKKAQLKELDQLAQSIFYTMFGDPITNEKGWEVKKLGDCFIIGSGGTPSKAIPEYWEGGDIPWIGSNMCQNCIIEKTDGKFITEEGLNHSSAKMLESGTVLVALVGATIGKVALLKTNTAINQNIAFVRLKQTTSFTPEFVYYHLMGQYDEFINIGDGKFKMANQAFIKSLSICVPPLSLQQEFADKVEAIERQKTLVQQSIAETQTLFDSRMDYWFG